VRDEVYRRIYLSKTTVFLCGARPDKKDSVRRKVKDTLQSGIYVYRYDIFLPEELFEEVATGIYRQDLISLENMLADSVDAIVLILESYGAIAELGCFSSNARLRGKLVCLVDAKHKRRQSFINNGPLRLLKDKKEGLVLYIDYKNPDRSMSHIRSAIARVAKHGSKSPSVTNVIQAHHFVLSCIYLLELVNLPVYQDELIQLVRYASGADESKALILTISALAMLRRNREVEITPGRGYRLAPAGSARFAVLKNRSRATRSVNVEAMDEMRVGILNWRYRGKRLAVK
jgi:hypothetical protein